MTELPSAWELFRLDEIAEVRLGRQRSPKNHSGADMRPYLRAANIGWSGLLLDDVKEMNFTADEMPVYRLQFGDILLSEASGSPDEVGKPAMWSGQIEECAFQNTLLRVRSRGPEPQYLLYFLRHLAISGAFARRSRGVGIHHIGRAALASWPVPVPSMAEQRRIIEILEDHLSRLDAADMGIAAAGRRAVNLQGSTIASALESVGGESWSLEDLSLSIRNGIFVSRAQAVGTGVRILRIGAVRPLALDLGDLRYSERGEADLQKEGALVSPGNLLFTRYNGNPKFVGACAVVPTLSEPLTYPDKLIRVVVNEDVAHPDFVAFACTASQGRRQIERGVKTTAGQAGISGRYLRQVVIRLPDRNVQERIVEEVKQRLDAIDQVARSLGVARRRSLALRRTLLAAAFSGRLT